VDRELLVALGGALGSVLRYATNGIAIRWLGLDFPYGTMIVNLVGSFLIGVVQALAAEAAVVPEPARLFLSAGVMGGFTTYSAFAYETVGLMSAEAWPRAAANIVVTTAGCLTLCAVGIAAGRGVLALRG
jgi:CrcB protein